MRVLIVVTHLLGTGHLSRALTLARAFTAAGHPVTLASGGMPVPHLDSSGIDLVQLPPLRSNGTDFTTLLMANDRPVDDACLTARRAALHACLSPAPGLIITELFPFGRRILRAEFLSLLDAAGNLTSKPRILSSIRDILAPPSKPAKAQWADEIIIRYYDGVLVHSDPDRLPLSVSWPVSYTLAPRLIYTGFVTTPAPTPNNVGTGEILVSAGGGPVGQTLYQTALATARTDPRRWRLLVGGPDDRRAALAAQAPANVTIEPPRPDFRQMLPNAAASLSLCGYNTALDVLQSGVPAVFVPFDDGQEVEQGLRAQSLAALPRIATLSTAGLTPDTLRDALAQVTAPGPARSITLKDNGAAETVRICERMLAR